MVSRRRCCGVWRVGATASLLVASVWACGKTSADRGAAARGAAGSAGLQHTDGAGGVNSSSATGNAGGSATSGSSAGGGADCSFQGQVYADGSTFAEGDGCNTCGCADGLVQCTALSCDPASAGSGGISVGASGSQGAAIPAAGASGSAQAGNAAGAATSGGGAGGSADCSFQGQVYADGSTFPAGDGCNTCGCADGLVQCTALSCDPASGGSGGISAGGAGGVLPTGGTGAATDTGGSAGAGSGGAAGTGGHAGGGMGGALPTGGAGGAATGGASGAADTGGTAGSGADCEYQGQVYADGSTFPAGDGCNTCGCTDGSVQCTVLWCDPVVDPGLLDVWYFDVLTGAIRWYEVGLCEGGRALVWTSFSGTGDPDQDTPIEGGWTSGGLTVTVTFDDPSVEGGPEWISLEYDPDTDTVALVDVHEVLPWHAATGVRLAPLSSVVYRLSCD